MIFQSWRVLAENNGTPALLTGTNQRENLTQRRGIYFRGGMCLERESERFFTLSVTLHWVFSPRIITRLMSTGFFRQLTNSLD